MVKWNLNKIFINLYFDVYLSTNKCLKCHKYFLLVPHWLFVEEGIYTLVNMIGRCIVDDKAVRKAAEEEIIRRYYSALCDYKQELCSRDTVERIEIMMNKLGLKMFLKITQTQA